MEWWLETVEGAECEEWNVWELSLDEFISLLVSVFY